MTDHPASEPPPCSIKHLVINLVLLLVVFAMLTSAVFFATRENTPGTDFYIYFTAARNITNKGISPYSENVGQDSQLAILKRFSMEDEDQLRFVYPPYALLPVLPLAVFPFPLAQAAWMALGFMTLSLAFFFAFPDPPRWLAASLLSLYPIFFGFLLGNFDILLISLIFLLAGRLPTVKPGNKAWQVGLGLCLAWLTIKPQFVWFYFLIFMLIAYKKRLTTLFISFSIGLIGLILFSFLIVPNWVTEWLYRVMLYPSYTGGQITITPVMSLFFPSQYLPYAYAASFLIYAGVSIFLLFKWNKGLISTLPLYAFGGFFIFSFHPHGNSYEQLTFLIPVIFWIISSSRNNPRLAAAYWIILVLTSWFLFYIGRFGILPQASNNGLFLLFTIWLFFGLVLPPAFLYKYKNL